MLCRIALFEMRNAEEAKKVIAGLNNTPMDKSHTFHLYTYADLLASLEENDSSKLPSKESFGPLQKVMKQP